MSFFGGGDDDLFGGLFDLDGDGKCSFEEAFIIHELFASDEELKLEYGEEDDKTQSFDDEDNSETLDEFNAEIDDGTDDDADVEDEENDEEYVTDEEDDSNEEDDSDGYSELGVRFGRRQSDRAGITIPIKISFGFNNDSSEPAPRREDYPNERTYEAADLLNSINRYPGNYDLKLYKSDIERCHFILEHPEITAARYLSHRNGFLFTQAVKERFKLPINLPDDDEDIHTSFSELFRKVSRHNPEYAVRLWHWCLTMFTPYLKYGDNDEQELTSFIMCDISETGLATVAEYAEEHPHFITVFLQAMNEIPCMMEDWIAIYLTKGSVSAAKTLFAGCLSKKQIESDAKEYFVSSIIEKCCNDDEKSSAKCFRDNLLPLVTDFADKPMRKKISDWQSEIAEYIKNYDEENDEDWREDCAYMRSLGVNPNDFITEDECQRAYQIAQAKQEAEREAKEEQRNRLCSDLEAGHDMATYLYCAVLLDGTSRCYYYLTDEESIRIGDKVIVPAGDDNKEMTGTVASVEHHTALSIPFPVEKTKQIIRKA